MIAYLLLSLGTAGTAAVLYQVAPAARGAHRYVVPHSVLRAEAARKDAQADELACKLVGLCAELDGAYEELHTALTGKESAEQRIKELEQQLKAFDAICAENTQLRSDLANARAVRQLWPGPSPADDASSLPDELQQFADQTATAWRARA
ncbi:MULTISPECIES: hypothetical protein [unclassified Streptomyces]|uniref:hypothetical protein n=1 Tax=unclassified Streptomyces TaxID=2593676 RepID=UPI000FFE3E0A|nr:MULTISPECIES: hypothetical protein [unclassified Streptomyces]